MPTFIITILLSLSYSYLFSSLCQEEIFSNSQNKSIEKFFYKKTSPFAKEIISTKPKLLLKAAEDVLKYLTSTKGIQEYAYIIKNNYPNLTKNKNFRSQDLFTKKAQKTLQFIIWSIKNDLKNNRSCRIKDPEFLNKHFEFLSWKPDYQKAEKNKVSLPDKKQIRTTKYAVFSTQGSKLKSKDFPHALYTFNNEEEAEQIRLKFTKQDILTGILEEKEYAKKVKPLVWVSRQGLEEALMQGTISINMPNEKQKFFGVDKNNGRSYDQKIKNPYEQKRYWYFKELSKGNTPSSQKCVIHNGGIALAGDIYNIGLGKIIALKHVNNITKKEEINLGILIDTGGAFTENLYQLDQFTGIFENRREFFDKTKHLPEFAQAYILIKK